MTPEEDRAINQAMYRGMFHALSQASCYEVHMTLSQETTSPWLGTLQPGRNFINPDTPQKQESMEALVASGVLVLIREPTTMSQDELLVAGLMDVERREASAAP